MNESGKNAERITELEERVADLIAFKNRAEKFFDYIGRVFSIELELAKRDQRSDNRPKD